MAFNEELANQIRQRLIALDGYNEKKMFGGICFLLNGNMACGIVHDSLIVRVGPLRYNEALQKPDCGVFDLTGRPMTGWVQVQQPGWQQVSSLDDWLAMGVAYACTLPPK